MSVQPQPWLAPLSPLVGGLAAVRAGLYRRGLFHQSRLQGPVLSVGNLSVGGSGKTPVVSHLARLLMAEGHPVAILSRGYGGSFRGNCLIVSDGKTVLHSPASAGDEPVMLARQAAGAVVAIGAQRDVVGRAVEAALGPRVHVLDDGFQHLRLARDLDIVCVSMRDLSDRPLPGGWLREDRAALDRAQVILLASDGADPSALGQAVAALGSDRAFRIARKPRGFFAPDGSPRPAPRRAFLLSGIARPERFAADVADGVPEIAGHDVHRDHHRFTEAELTQAQDRARARGADAVVTTEKDLVRIAPRAWDPPLMAFAIDVEIEDAPRWRARVLRAVTRPVPSP
jgi:tetraacyldisaccharide 4'-kinase